MRPFFFSMSRLRARIRLPVAWSSNSASDFARRFAVVFTHTICLNSVRRSIPIRNLEQRRTDLGGQPEIDHPNFTQTDAARLPPPYGQASARRRAPRFAINSNEMMFG